MSTSKQNNGEKHLKDDSQATNKELENNKESSIDLRKQLDLAVMNVASIKGQLEGMMRLLKTPKELEKKVEMSEKGNVPEKHKNGNYYLYFWQKIDTDSVVRYISIARLTSQYCFLIDTRLLQ